MRNLLSEEIERYKKLSFYNSKLTSTENNNIIFEAVFNPRATALEVEKAAGIAAGGGLMSLITKFKIVRLTTEELQVLLSKSPAEFEKLFNKALAQDFKAGKTAAGELGPAAKNLSKVDLLRRMASESQLAGGRALTTTEINNLINEIKLANKGRAMQFKPKLPKPKPEDIKIGEEIIQTYPSLKNLDWKSLVKKGAVLGLSVGALYYIYKLTHEDEPPIPVPPIIEPPIPNPSQYKSCPETFPIAKFCKNETIRKVQGCLGITADSLFGPKTQAALEAKGVDGTSITQQTVDKVCNNAPLVDPDTEDVDGQDPNTI
jgi:hypothetical protein